jgi:hypothetical protein
MAQKKKWTKVATSLPPDLLAKLRAYVDDKGTKIQTVFADAIRAYLGKQ